MVKKSCVKLEPLKYAFNVLLGVVEPLKRVLKFNVYSTSFERENDWDVINFCTPLPL